MILIRLRIREQLRVFQLVSTSRVRFNVILNIGEVLSLNSIGARAFANGYFDNSGTMSGRSFYTVTRDGNGIILNSSTISAATAVILEGNGTFDARIFLDEAVTLVETDFIL